MAEDVQGVSSTPEPTVPLDPAEAAVISGDQSAFKEIRLAQRTGKPVPKIEPTDTESAPVEPAAQAASTDATPKAASEPAKPTTEKRIQDLLTDRAEWRSKAERLEARLAQLERGQPDVKPAASSTATPREFERYKAMPDAPKLEDFNDYGDWAIEAAAHVARKQFEELTQRQQHESQAKQHNDQLSSMTDKGKHSFDDFDDVLREADKAGLTWPEPIVQLILTHEKGHEIAYLLAKERIADPVKAGMAIAGILSPPSEPSPVPQKTKAPEPPEYLGTRPHDLPDALETAIASDDMTAFKAERLRRRMAQR